MSYVCQDESHEGDPSNIHITDRLERRIEYRRLSDYGRERVFKDIDVCRSCLRRRHPMKPSNQLSILSARTGDLI